MRLLQPCVTSCLLQLQVTVDVNVTFYEGKPWQAILPHGLTTWTMSFDRCGTVLQDLVRESYSNFAGHLS